MKARRSLVLLVLSATVSAQSVAIFPSEYAAVPEGPLNSPNLPFAYGTSRVLCAYNRLDLQVPNGASIRSLGFRQDATITAMSPGRGLQLEIRMGYTSNTEAALSGNFDANYVGTPVTVFGPALFTLPNLNDPASPLPNGRFAVNLTTPFPYNPGANNLLVEYRVFGTSGGGSAFNYYLDRADFYSPVVNGPAGCSHSSGGPATLTAEPTRTGYYYTANAAAAPTNAFCVLAMSVGGQLTAPYSLAPYAPGIAPQCMGQVPLAGAASLTSITNNGGTTYFSFLIPNTPLLNDVHLAAQCAFFDFFAPGGIVVSNGADVQVGILPRSSVVYAQGPPATTATGSVATAYCPVAFFGYQ